MLIPPSVPTLQSRTQLRHAVLLLTLLLTLLWSNGNPSSRAARLGAEAKTQKPGSSRIDPPVSASRAREAYGKLPLRFEVNRGQTDSRVRFISRGDGYSLFLTESEAVLSLREDKGDGVWGQVGLQSEKRADGKGRHGDAPDVWQPIETQNSSSPGRTSSAVVRLRFAGANRAPKIEGLEELEGRTHYLSGRDASKWRTNVDAYARVRYEKIYPGVDLIFYGNQRQLEYDFLLAPGADPNVIRLSFEGADKILIDDRGELVLSTPAGAEVRQHRPFVYQELNGTRKEVAGRYVLKGRGEVGFELGEYNARLPVVIDPVLTYSTYLGGGSDDGAFDIAVDNSGNAYVTGFTTSVEFPVANPLHLPSPGKVNECFVTKLNASGTGVVYSTYIGGSSFDNGQRIAVDAAGSAYVMGNTSSSDFPVANAVQTTLKGRTDLFIFKLNAEGSALVYSTYLGGTTQLDMGTGLDVDASGSAYVTGYTYNTDFPVTGGAYQTTKNGPYTNIFLSKIAPAGSRLTYSTYFGGGGEYGPRVAVDKDGNAYLTGQAGTSLPTTPGAYQPARPNSEVAGDPFVAKINSAGTGLAYSTYLAGTGYDIPTGIAVDSSGSAYVVGKTHSSDFPATSTLLPRGSDGSAFVAKLNPAGSGLAYSTLLGGSASIYDVAVNATGSAYVVGLAFSGAQVTAGAIQDTPAGMNDAYLAKLNPAGTALLYATYFGGNNGEWGSGVALDPAGNMYVAGYTFSSRLPVVPGSLRTKYSGGSEGFVLKISEGAPLSYTIAGRIADARGTGIGGVTLTLSGAEGTTQTDADGNYSFTLPAYGSYVVTPAKAGYVFNAYSHSFDNLNSNRTANFTGTATNTSYTIKGSVRGTDFFGLRVDELTLGGSVSGSTLNTSSGTFSFKNLAAGGTYTVTPVLPGYKFEPASITFNNLNANKTEEEATFVGTKVASIYNLVTDPNNSGLGGVKISVTKGDGTIHTLSTGDGNETTNGEGLAALLKLSRGETYTVTPSSPNLKFTPASLTFQQLNNDPGAKFVASQEDASATPTPSPAATPNPSSNATASVPVFAVNTNDELLLFNSNSPETIFSRKKITGLGTVNHVVAIDVRPSTGQLYALVSRDFSETLPPLHLYTINPATGAATDLHTPPFGRHAVSYGFDFNPVTDRIRLVSDADDNLTINPSTGAVTTNTPLSYAPGDASAARNPAIGGAAYSNNFAAATTTTLYDIDFGNNPGEPDLLARQGSAGGTPVSPDAGQLTTVGALNFNSIEFVGFDIAPGSTDAAYAALLFMDGPSQFFSVNLNTGAATRIGNIGNQIDFVRDIAVASHSANGDTLQFNAGLSTVLENCTAVTVNVTRTGQATAPVSVEYSTNDNSAKQKSDYTFAAGRLDFAPGETSKTFEVLITEDSYAEPTESLTLTLSRPTNGATLGTQQTAVLEIADDGDTTATPNPTHVAHEFVCQHYHDFLNREPDTSGLAFWKNQIEECTTQGCREVRRINVSAAFFLSVEFQQTGYLVYRFHQAAFNAGERLKYQDFLADTQSVGRGVVVGVGDWQQRLEANKQSYAEEFVLRAPFVNKYPTTQTPAEFVDALNANTGGSLSQTERDALVNALSNGTMTRAQVLRSVAEDGDFKQKEFKRAFVLMQYFGYLRRNPDDAPDADFSGYQFWLGKLNQFGGDYVRAEMVKAFITSSEYKQRFGPQP